jgi:hypothetical protein
MEQDRHPAYLYGQNFLTVDEVRKALLAAEPERYKHHTDREWEALTYQVEALAKVLWRMAQRQMEEERETASTPGDPGPAGAPCR